MKLIWRGEQFDTGSSNAAVRQAGGDGSGGVERGGGDGIRDVGSAMMALDRRPGTNRMGPETRMVHERLEAWGRWCRENLNGFPPNTILGRMADGELPGFQSRPPINLPEPIAITDRAVGRLVPLRKTVIFEYYTRWEAPEVIAQRMRMKPKDFLRVLDNARVRIGCYIEILEDQHADFRRVYDSE